jgi:transposase
LNNAIKFVKNFRMDITGRQWIKIEPVILQSLCKKDSRGRKPRDPREVLNGILWVLRTSAPWKACLSGIRRTRPATDDSSTG